MREIKFRGWDTTRKKMWSAKEMGVDELTVSPDGRGFVNIHGSSIRMSQYMSHIIPLQYTGLKDKNGMEIYEGDIVEFTVDSEQERSEVIFDGSGFSVSAKNTDPNYIPYLGEVCNIEVIGNIYENQELLNATS